ncbi:MAG: helix-turn-helix transcriptional regulator [Planctomycetes bacterium]|nr:helix-turn-helix transcriptional regulator [Planctomycetota bacterium]
MKASLLHLLELPEPPPCPVVSRTIHQRDAFAYESISKGPKDYQVNYLLEGRMDCELGHRKVQMLPGDLVICFPGRPYRITRETHVAIAKYHCHFSFGDLKPIAVAAPHEWASLALRMDAQVNALARTLCVPDIISVRDRHSAESILSSMFQEQRDAHPGSALAARTRLLLLLQQVSRQAIEELASEKRTEKPSRSHLQVARALDFIEGQIAKPISLHDLAQHLRLNPEHLSRIFRSRTGKSVGEYILRRKMNFAKELLIASGKSVKEVSASVGFRDPLYFSRQFRKSEGLSPTEFLLNNGL